MAVERRRILYRGHVQGVGFRYTTRHLAGGFRVVGSVRNLDDGRVEVVAEGEPGELDAFQDAIAREFGGHVRGVDVEPMVPGEPPLEGFFIRH